MLDIYTVTFIGHRYIDRFSFVEDKVEELVRELIGSKPYVDFLVGRDGDFDQIVSSTVLRVKKRVFDANSSLIWVMPYETAEYRDNVESFGVLQRSISVMVTAIPKLSNSMVSSPM